MKPATGMVKARRMSRRVHHTAATNHVNHENPINAGVQLPASQYRRCTLNVTKSEAATDMAGEMRNARAAVYAPSTAMTRYIQAMRVALSAKLSVSTARLSRRTENGLNTPNWISPAISDRYHDGWKFSTDPRPCPPAFNAVNTPIIWCSTSSR